ncbi:MAG: ECF transporter S component [Peptostreptococcales bacterium]|jgi:energy-coupling factor transport system substrate-specific component
MNSGILSIGLILLVIAIMFIVYEKKNTTLKEISLIGTLAGIAGIMRIPFGGIPNVQPTTALVIIAGWVFGPLFGFMVGALSVLVSNSFLGHGPWTPWQMFAWGMAGLLSGSLSKIKLKPSKIFLGVYGFLWGFAYDYILNLWHFLTFIYPRTWSSFVLVYMSSFYFDLLHGLFNLFFLYFFGHELITILRRFKDKLIVYSIKEERRIP